MNQLNKLYVIIQNRLAADDGVISTETAVVGAVILTAAAAVAAKFTGLFESALTKIPDSIE